MKKNKKNLIPIVFTFNDNYALPAAVAIKSLITTGKINTTYKIYCLYQDLSKENRQKLNKIAKINWIKVSKSLFNKVPATREYPVDVYYRLAISDILTQYDKIIYSDVDVLFQGDLSSVYNINLKNYYWAGVPLEKNEVPNAKYLKYQTGDVNDVNFMSGHTKFSENKNNFIYASGFMVINSKKMRKDNMTEKFIKIIDKFNSRLKMFDLEILNLACQNNTIYSLPFDYCVLEDIIYSKEFSKSNLYPFLSQVFSDNELKFAINKPVIIHYTGGKDIRVWNREIKQQPLVYRFFVDLVRV